MCGSSAATFGAGNKKEGRPTIQQNKGDELWYEDTCYKIGARVLANDQSEYEGLFGMILEIRTGAEKETENDTPDIYCAFDPPVLSADRKALEQTFSELYHEPKRVEDMGLDCVIMSPEMLTLLPIPEQDYPHVTLYAVASHWANDGECGAYEIPFTSLIDAKRQFHDDLRNEQDSGSIENWRQNSQFVEEETEDSYECYLDGEYCENHFSIALKRFSLPIASSFMETVAGLWQAKDMREDFLEQVEDWEEYQALTDPQRERWLASPDFPQRLLARLRSSTAYQKAYWEAVSEVAATLLKELVRQPDNKK